MNRDALPESFVRDRSEMRGHATPTMEQIASGLPHQEGQLHHMLGWVDDAVGDERLYAAVEGEVVHASRNAIAIRREDPQVGAVHVHFPRLGYEVAPV